MHEFGSTDGTRDARGNLTQAEKRRRDANQMNRRALADALTKDTRQKRVTITHVDAKDALAPQPARGQPTALKAVQSDSWKVRGQQAKAAERADRASDAPMDEDEINGLVIGYKMHHDSLLRAQKGVDELRPRLEALGYTFKPDGTLKRVRRASPN